MMQLLAFGLIFLSASIHASWNTLMRHLKGNASALVVAHFIGAIFHVPILIALDQMKYVTPCSNLASSSYDRGISKCTIYFIASVLSHVGYLTSLPIAYAFGDVGLIYPLARGTAIIVATLISHFYMEEVLTVGEGFGVLVAVIGIVSLSYDAYLSSKAKLLDEKNRSKMSNIVYKELSTVEMTTQGGDDIDIDDDMLEDDYDFDGDLSSRNNSKDNTALLEKEHPPIYENKLKMSIILAIFVGMCTASYSLLDSQGVDSVPPVVWSFWLNISSSSLLLVILYNRNREQMSEVLTVHKWSVLILAPAVVGAYLIILYVFQLPGTNVGLVVCLREVSVVIGAILGVLLLKESYSALKFGSIALILIGIVTIKLASS